MKRIRKNFSFAEEELKTIKQKMLSWSSRFSIFLFLDSNAYSVQGGCYECLVGAGSKAMLAPDQDLFSQLEQFHRQHHDWLFGHIAYDAKNLIEPTLRSVHPAKHHFPIMQFFVPEVVMGIEKGCNELFIETTTQNADLIYQEVIAQAVPSRQVPRVEFQQRIAPTDYLQKIEALLEHIRNGDCYEINFCNEGFCEEVALNAVDAFHKLNDISPSPFAACYRTGDHYLMCASPERYIRKQGSKLLCQPIKGTARRGNSPDEDAQLKEALYSSEKERAENVMIVDLMRNDLARSCDPGSIQVEELFGIYTFPQVHQMVSTVSGQLREHASFAEALQNSFPMGSMTGAPKVKVMELIERYEESRRGLFSGTVGYITPNGDFDFNVVIRSLFYNVASGYLSYQTGGAITWDSEAQSEWEEMRLKAGAIERVFA